MVQDLFSRLVLCAVLRNILLIGRQSTLSVFLLTHIYMYTHRGQVWEGKTAGVVSPETKITPPVSTLHAVRWPVYTDAGRYSTRQLTSSNNTSKFSLECKMKEKFDLTKNEKEKGKLWKAGRTRHSVSAWLFCKAVFLVTTLVLFLFVAVQKLEQ